MTVTITTLVSLILYAGSFYLADRTGVSWPMTVLGLLMWFGILPYAAVSALRIRGRSVMEYWGMSLTFFFFVVTPLFFVLNKAASFVVSAQSLIGLAGVIALVSLIARRLQGMPDAIVLPISSLRDLVAKVKAAWPFLVVLALFALVHSINFSFYTFIPEWDGYTDLTKIAEVIKSGFVAVEYRSFFLMAMSLLSVATHLDPYTVFSTVMIGLQTSLIFVMYQLIQDYGIKSKGWQFVILLATLAVPVLSMEIDMTRPQNIVILGLPFYILFFYRAVTTRSLLFLILSTLIAVAGLNYHEFFFFICVAHFAWGVWFVYQHFFVKARDSRDRLLFGLGLALTAVIAMLLPQVQAVWDVVERVATNISRVSAWRWWFLGGYNTDGPNLNLGWPGIDGAARYYAYYAGPLALLILLLLLLAVFRRSQVIKDNLVRVTLPLLCLFVLFAEVFPRLNFVLIPERFWVLMSMLAILLFVPLSQAIIPRLSVTPRRVFEVSVFLLICIGILGAGYVARGKKALTSPEEFTAAQWIKANTPPNAVFISQAANGPMVFYFADRDIISPKSDFFMSPSLEVLDLQNRLKALNADLVKVKNSARIETETYLSQESANLFLLTGQLSTIDATIRQLQREIKDQEKLLASPRYVLYSENKFTGLYAEREWWRLANFYGADLAKFDKVYPVVYRNHGVTIWEVK